MEKRAPARDAESAAHVADSLDRLFIRVIKLHFAKAQQLFGAIGLHRGQPPVLFRLSEKDGQTQRELAEGLFVTPATMTVILKRMEKAGYLERRPDQRDRRLSRVYITAQGKALQEQARAALAELEAQCYQGFTADEKQQLRHFFTRMKANLDSSGDASYRDSDHPARGGSSC